MRTNKYPNRADVARALRELELQFGKKPPDKNGNAAGKSGAGDSGKLKTRGSK